MRSGMVFGSWGQGGPMGQHTLPNARSSRAKAMCTISPSRVNGAPSCGMHTYSGSGQPCTEPLSSCPSVVFHTLSLNPTRKLLSYWVCSISLPIYFTSKMKDQSLLGWQHILVEALNHFGVCESGEWWKSDTEAVINQAIKSGLAPNVSDAHTINGHPGPSSNCPSQGNNPSTNIAMKTTSESWWSSLV